MLDSAGWTYALVVIVLTIAIHTTGLVSIGLIRPRVRSLLLKKDPTTWRWGIFLTCHIAAAGLALVALHAAESALWAVAYLRAGAVGSLNDALLYSLSAMTGSGTSVALAYRWQMMAALEALNGIILFGMSTALIVGIIQNYWTQFPGDHAGATDARGGHSKPAAEQQL